ncbi:5-oxoprolinase subunit PxpB [Bacillus suaedae]|uniref:5-oxoprolinase subunit PxpB n=1 Tax=Halalkalibacter suaedae TaxID=2822140 RepID=A0A940X0U1_9BACI|nr:5-oxoprolinase subunit PxpB [Bacillus suaedae]MBP3953325.1 5-oxoprolinase subunit PxpB [Bacillus suaedae]
MTSIQLETNIRFISETAVTIYVGQEISEENHEKVKALSTKLENDPFQGLIEVVPGFYSVTVHFDPLLVMRVKQQGETTSDYIRSFLTDSVKTIDLNKKIPVREIEIPVVYGGQYGPDLLEVAQFHQLTEEEVINLHSSKSYLVYMLGFAPGFPYLGGLSSKLTTPRRKKPRLRIKQGSVGIGGEQTGIYPIESPGGWQIIGQTPTSLFSPINHSPCLLQAGDRIRFKPITEEEFLLLKED